MASNSGTAVLLVILLGIAVGSANDDDGDTGTGDTSTGGLATGVQGFDSGTGDEDTCEGTTSYDSDTGTFVVPTDSNDDLFGARDCVLSTTTGGGAPVQALQNALATCYEQPVVADGVYGAGTAAAVQNVQAVNGLPADGVFGPATSEAMQWPTTSASGQVTCAANP